MFKDEADIEKSKEFKVIVYSDVVANNSLILKDFETALKFICNLPKYTAATNSSKGKLVKYVLLLVRAV